MPPIDARALGFASYYDENIEKLIAAANRCEDLVKSIVRISGVSGATISARLKGRASLREKLLIKQYANPQEDFPDLIGVRIITLFDDEVKTVGDRLSLEFDVIRDESEDKRKRLLDDQFGYRSLHLVCKLKSTEAARPDNIDLDGIKFEIQIRSLAQHAWAEVGHDLSYKVGIEPSAAFKRSLGRLAASLELVDEGFGILREWRSQQIQAGIDQEQAGTTVGTTKVDTAILIAILTCAYPENPRADHLFGRRVNSAFLVEGLTTADAARAAVQSKDTVTAMADLASNNGVAPVELDLYQVATCVIRARNPDLVPFLAL